ncbi:glycoside hydrolase family 95-like protein [Sphingobacterium sp. NGMCC 1.201703]|uniref:glycoside hydrolase family 95-like protein n=1 Tax=unclassified Sphingobacterium TaxID=2609468 RepID=UPI00397D5C3B
MCLQSHVRDKEENYIIELLPALGDKMPDGKIKGLKARGNIEVDITWGKGQLKQAVLKPKYHGNVVVRYRNKTIQLKSDDKGQIDIGPELF